MLICFSVQRKGSRMVSTLKGKMTDHRGYVLVVMGKALFPSNATANGFCIKLNQSYRRLLAVACKPAGVMFLLILHLHSLRKTVAITCQMVLITGAPMCVAFG